MPVAKMMRPGFISLSINQDLSYSNMINLVKKVYSGGSNI